MFTKPRDGFVPPRGKSRGRNAKTAKRIAAATVNKQRAKNKRRRAAKKGGGKKK